MSIPLLLFRHPKRKPSSSSVTPLTFLFDEQFTTDDAAPIGIPRAAEPGPGTWGTLNDAGNRMSISGGALVTASGGGTGDPNMYSSTTFTRSPGLALAFTIKNMAITNICTAAFRSNTGTASVAHQLGIMPTTTISIHNYNNNVSSSLNVRVPTMSGDCRFFTVLKSVGNWNIKKVSGVYRLVFRTWSGTNTNMPIHLGVASAATVDDVRVAQLGHPFSDESLDTDLRLFLSTSPTSGETQTAAAEAFHITDWTPAAGGTFEYQIRRQDDNNYWSCQANQTAGTVKIFEVVAGVPTERATFSGSITAGTAYKVITRYEGTTINFIVVPNTLSAGQISCFYTTATNFQTATGSKIVYTNSTTVANWEALKLELPSDAIAELDRM